MQHPDRTPRRGFLARLAAGAAAFAAGAAPSSAQAVAPAAARGEPHPNDRWLDALAGRHRQIYDIESPERVSAGLGYARNFLNASGQPYGLSDRDLSVVVSLRHTAVPFALADQVWETYGLGEYASVQDPASKAPARRNPHLGGEAGAAASTAATLRALHARGVVFSVCGLSFGRMVRELAGRSGQTQDVVRAALTAGLVPGAVVVTAGVVALNRAQERGFSYIAVG
jgi:intracellular sulfur oxidation DsrE/DsrF family protein